MERPSGSNLLHPRLPSSCGHRDLPEGHSMPPLEPQHTIDLTAATLSGKSFIRHLVALLGKALIRLSQNGKHSEWDGCCKKGLNTSLAEWEAQ